MLSTKVVGLLFSLLVLLAGCDGKPQISLYLANALRNAASNGQTARVKALLYTGVNVNVQDEGGWTPLMYVTLEGHTDIVQALINKGADVNVKGKGGHLPMTALRLSAAKGHTDTVKILLNKI